MTVIENMSHTVCVSQALSLLRCSSEPGESEVVPSTGAERLRLRVASRRGCRAVLDTACNRRDSDWTVVMARPDGTCGQRSHPGALAMGCGMFPCMGV